MEIQRRRKPVHMRDGPKSYTKRALVKMLARNKGDQLSQSGEKRSEDVVDRNDFRRVVDRLDVRHITKGGGARKVPRKRQEEMITKSASMLKTDTNVPPPPPRRDRSADDESKMIERARKRLEEKAELKEKMKLDLIALKAEEEEERKAKQTKFLQLMEHERLERAKHLDSWKEKVERKETKKKLKEMKKKEAERRRLEAALKERQAKYISELRLKQEKKREKKLATDRVEEQDAKPKSRPGRRGLAKKLNTMKSSYDPQGKLKDFYLPAAQKKAKVAARLSDNDIVEMARKIVEEAKLKNNNNDNATPREAGGYQIEVDSDMTFSTPAPSAFYEPSGYSDVGVAVPPSFADPTIPVQSSLQISTDIEKWYKQQLESVDI
mmetsp:Transcript_16147/g.35071  ORF Transcript_16147/g.35071 Transcript_16147/m.35071 type:complete len:380 (-) Transcript_16147:2866-4005(-)